MASSNSGSSRQDTIDSVALGVELRDILLNSNPEAEEPRDDGKDARMAVQETARNPVIPTTPDRVLSRVVPDGSVCLEREQCHTLNSNEYLPKKSTELEESGPVQESVSDEHFVVQKRIQDAVFPDKPLEKETYQSQESVQDFEPEIDPESYPRCFKMEHYDVLIIYLKSDVRGAVKWRELLETRINVGKGKKLKVALLEQNEDGDNVSNEFPDIGSKFQVTEEGMNRSTFTHLFMSKEFVENNFQKVQVENCIMESINNEEKKWSVIPVFTMRKKNANFKVPFALMSLKGLDLSTFLEGKHLGDTNVQELKIEEKDRFFLSSLTKALRGRLAQREKREKLQKEALEKWLKDEKERLFLEKMKKRQSEELAQKQKETNRENYSKGLSEDKQRGLEEIANMGIPDIDTRSYWKTPEESGRPGLQHSHSYPSQNEHHNAEELRRNASWGAPLPPGGVCNGYPPPQMYPPQHMYYQCFDPRLLPHFQPNPGQGMYPYPYMPGYSPQVPFFQNPHQPVGYMNQPYYTPPGGEAPNQAPPPQPTVNQPEANRKRDSGGSDTRDNVKSGQIYIKHSRVVIQNEGERVPRIQNPESSCSSSTEYEIDYGDPSTMGSRDPGGSPSQQNMHLHTQTHPTPKGPAKTTQEQNTTSLPQESMRDSARPAGNTMSDRMSMRSNGNDAELCKTKGPIEDGERFNTKSPPEEKLCHLKLPEQLVNASSPESPLYNDCSPLPGIVENPLEQAAAGNVQDNPDISSHCQENQENTYEKQLVTSEDTVDGMQATVNNCQISIVSSGLGSLEDYFAMGEVLQTPDDNCQKGDCDDSFEIIDPKDLEQKLNIVGRKETQNNSVLLPSVNNQGQLTSCPPYTSTSAEDIGGGNRDENRQPSIPVENPREISYSSSEWTGFGDIEVAELATENM